jgi:hypothetical protein
MKTTLIILLIFLSLTPLAASAQEHKTGILYGPSHAFALQAPQGWVLDNKSGVSQNLYAVLYPVGTSWRESSAVMYSRGILKGDGIMSIKDQVDKTVKEFKESGSPKISVQFIKEITAEKGHKGAIYHYNGDQWGNHEAVVYFEEDKSINFIVLTTRTKEAFDSSLKAFEEAAASYMFITDDVQINKK